MARKTSTPTPAAVTTVLLVRHGTDADHRASCCPVAPPACTSPSRASSRPSGPVRGIAELQRVDAIYASPLERARETAAPIAAGARV